jgi:hypothetical protein
MSSWLYCTEEEVSWGAAIETVPLMRALVVVEGEEALEGAVDGCAGSEVAAAEGDSSNRPS